MYSDASGTYVVDVDHGAPGTPLSILSGSAACAWAPDGAHLACAQSGVVTLVDLSVSPPTKTIVTHPVVATPSADRPAYSHDGSSFVFTGAQERISRDAYYVKTDAASPTAVHLGHVLTGTQSASGPSWNATLPWVGFLAYEPSGVLYASDLGAASPTDVALGAASTPFYWLPASPRLVAAGSTTTIDLVDPRQPGSPVRLVSDTSTFDKFMPGSESVLAYNLAQVIKLVSIDDPAKPPTVIRIVSGLYDYIVLWTWAPDAKFIAVSEYANAGGTYALKLMRVSGTAASTVVTINGRSSGGVYYFWQP
jgi:hypothetical protein